MAYLLEKVTGVEKLARVVSETKGSYQVGLVDGSLLSIDKKRLKECYYVGDIVRLDTVAKEQTISGLIERNRIVKKARNKTAKDEHFAAKEQILATNVDQLMILLAVDQNLSLAKLERYLMVFGQEELDAHVLLTKCDLDDNYKGFIAQVNALYPEVHIHPVSLYQPEQLQEVQNLLPKEGVTLLIGSSGAGKTSLINSFLGEEVFQTQAVRKDSKGKHTTTTSLMIPLPQTKGYLIDTPGFKGIDSRDRLYPERLFGHIYEIAEDCKFSNCKHDTEPGCAIKVALTGGELANEIWQRYCYHSQSLTI
ncbi:ribosome small subunit-dependent GTPase A [Streptococcus moroccensis]|uniref:Ribosome biogenesis GTPase n=1 Tax=Streptococcus moroccensis TaxID=1451356 RepID=A0ABT9YRM6_9STRE|nr:ribosome small subunit-dependent GTPase A [Streptococcus moroccensis]MDQ0221765.1 ribosome biogenesis GTPase [Streptococcus moroccensis]